MITGAKIGAALMVAAVLVSGLLRFAEDEAIGELERLARQKRELREKFIRECTRIGYYTRAGCELEADIVETEANVVVTLPHQGEGTAL